MAKKDLRNMSRVELEQRAEAIQYFLDAEEELGCGCTPASYYADLYEELYEIDEMIAATEGYSSAAEMFFRSYRI